MTMKSRVSVLLFLLMGLWGCQDSSVGTPVFHHQGKPSYLSDWNVLRVQGQTLELAESVVAYDLNTPLFSDYAHKLRTVWVPKGHAAEYSETNSFEFPIGTIISKTFYYPTQINDAASSQQVINTDDTTAKRLLKGINLSEVKLIETRLLVHREEGWVALPYVWNTDETDAMLKRVGDIKKLTLNTAGREQDFNYVVPNENQCAGCHATNATTRKLRPIGPRSRHLNKNYDYSTGTKNQLKGWVDLGILASVPANINVKANAVWGDENQDLNHRARSYLDINCSHCHNAVGPADTSGLLLEPSDVHGSNLGVCKLPIAAGTGTGNRKYGIVPGKPEESIFTYRMKSTVPSEMMPELGRSLSHKEGVELIEAWIAGMDGRCETIAM